MFINNNINNFIDNLNIYFFNIQTRLNINKEIKKKSSID